ncbi:MAG TPA: hypothetical protein VNH19_18900, partial [Candidatus Limnocylindrales bacterium]|nr:hypothetical protein [Candidatus Limnocylindrales bacterium]
STSDRQSSKTSDTGVSSVDLYTVLAGTPCYVRRIGATKWQPHKTTIQISFPKRQLNSAGTHATLSGRDDGWEMMIAIAHLDCIPADKRRRTHGTAARRLHRYYSGRNRGQRIRKR